MRNVTRALVGTLVASLVAAAVSVYAHSSFSECASGGLRLTPRDPCLTS